MQARLFIIVLVSTLTIGGVAQACHDYQTQEIQPTVTPPVCTETQQLNEAKDTCIDLAVIDQPEQAPAPQPETVLATQPAPAPAPAPTPVPHIQPVPAAVPEPAPVTENWGK